MSLLISSINFLLWGISAFFFYKLVTCFVSIKNNLFAKITVIIGFLAVVAITIHPNDIVNVVGVFLLFLFLMVSCFEGTIYRRISVIFILYPIIIAINFLTENTGLYIFQAFGGILIEDMGKAVYDISPFFLLDGFIHHFFLILTILFWFLLYQLFKNQLTTSVKFLGGKTWGIISLVCLAPLVSVITFVSFTPKITWLVYPAILSCIITSVGILLITKYIAKSVSISMENKNLRLQEIYYKELEKNQTHISKLRHDMNNHLNVIGTFFEQNNVTEAEQYFKHLSDDFTSGNRLFCKNSIVNAVLNTKYNFATDNQIDCFFNISLDNMLSIDDISLCSIFANTLDNAIEASLKIAEPSQRKISIKARYVNGYFSYEISNAKINELTEKKGVLQTAKINKKMHGIGLSSVNDIVMNYGGIIDISYNDTNFSVVLLIGNT